MVNNLPLNAGDIRDAGSIPVSGRSPGWQPTPILWPGESSWTEESGGLQHVGSQGVGHD